jgi:hypothetical protein
MRAHLPQNFRFAALASAIAAPIALLAAASPIAVQASTSTKIFANERYHYVVALPAGCRHEEGPGTIDAICASDFDPERSAQASSATALVLEVSAEAAAEDGARTAADLAQRYGEKAFREELPEAVCGESEASRARITSVKQTLEGNRLVYTAEVICAEVRFLQIAERRALVRYVIEPNARYRLFARAPIEDFDKQKQAIGAFFDSFRVMPAGQKEQ